MQHPGRFGFEPGGEFAPAFEAAQRRLRGLQTRRRGELAEATRRVRTSGVRFLPQETLERGGQEAEAGLVGRFALQQAGENIQDRRLREAFERRRQFQREGFGLESALRRRLGRGQLGAQLGAGAIGAIGNILTARAGGLFPVRGGRLA